MEPALPGTTIAQGIILQFLSNAKVFYMNVLH